MLYAGFRLLRSHGDETIDIENNRMIKVIRRFIPLTDSYHQHLFFVMQQGKRMATPLFLVLIFVDIIDVVFAVDSIPAIFAVTQDSFIVYTSNVFAILGLRSLYFLLEGIVNKFVYLRYGLAAVLMFVGVKLLIKIFDIEISNILSLLVIVLAIGISIFASLRFGQKESSH